VENLLDLPYLQFLDLSENLIETLKLGKNAFALAHEACPVFSLLAFTTPTLHPACIHFILTGSELV
jgi:hypothetical protein